jgi:hypothetical protein
MEINLPVSQSFFMATPFNFLWQPRSTFYGNPVQLFMATPFNVSPTMCFPFNQPFSATHGK